MYIRDLSLSKNIENYYVRNEEIWSTFVDKNTVAQFRVKDNGRTMSVTLINIQKREINPKYIVEDVHVVKTEYPYKIHGHRPTEEGFDTEMIKAMKHIADGMHLAKAPDGMIATVTFTENEI